MIDYHCITLLFKELNVLKTEMAKIEYYSDHGHPTYIRKMSSGIVSKSLARLTTASDFVLSLTQPRIYHDVEDKIQDFNDVRGDIASYYKYKDKPFFKELSVKEAIKWR